MEKDKQTIRDFILKHFLKGEPPESLTDSMALNDSGVLDSLNTLKLVEFLEKTFSIEINSDDLNIKNFSSVGRICEFVQQKKS